MTPDCVSPNVTLLIQYGLYHLSQDSKIFPLAGCINTLVSRDPIMPRKGCEAVSEGNCPIPQQEEFGSGEPTLADIYRLYEERFDRMDSFFDRWDKKLDDIER